MVSLNRQEGVGMAKLGKLRKGVVVRVYTDPMEERMYAGRGELVRRAKDTVLHYPPMAPQGFELWKVQVGTIIETLWVHPRNIVKGG